MENKINADAEKFVPAEVWVSHNPVYLKAHKPTETPEGVYYTITSKPEEAIVTFYSRRKNTKDYYKKEV